MTKSKVSRRRFMHTSLSTAAVALPAAEALGFQLLKSADGLARVCQLVSASLSLPQASQKVLREFVASLRDGSREQTESPAYMAGLEAVHGSSIEDLAKYVAQELVAASNYLEVKAGLAESLVLLKA